MADPFRHAELVSASTDQLAMTVEAWTLNQVQGDGGMRAKETLSYTAGSVQRKSMPVFGPSHVRVNLAVTANIGNIR
jgi:hypothetical protein